MSISVSGRSPYTGLTTPATKPKTPALAGSVALDASAPVASGIAQQSTPALLNAYAKNVTGAGDVNPDAMIQAAGGDVHKARAAVVEGYAGEFYMGTRTNDGTQTQAATQQLYSDLNSGPGPKHDAAMFSLVASRFKNAGGEYNNQRLADKVKSADPSLANGVEGLGTKDVPTLAAVTSAIRSGKMKLSDVFDSSSTGNAGADSNSAIENVAQYKDAIAQVKAGNLGTALSTDVNFKEGDQKTGNAGNSPGMAQVGGEQDSGITKNGGTATSVMGNLGTTGTNTNAAADTIPATTYDKASGITPKTTTANTNFNTSSLIALLEQYVKAMTPQSNQQVQEDLNSQSLVDNRGASTVVSSTPLQTANLTPTKADLLQKQTISQNPFLSGLVDKLPAGIL
jgi:hypothetical protein